MQPAVELQRASLWKLPLLPQFLLDLGLDTQGAAWHRISTLQLTSSWTGISEERVP